MNERTKVIHVIGILLIVFALTSCESLDFVFMQGDEEAIQASGVIEAVDVSISSEISGRVTAVHAQEGDEVEQGDLLFELNTEMIQAQRKQAQAQVETARSNLKSSKSTLAAAKAGFDAAEAALQSAELEYERVLREARLTEALDRVGDWDQSSPAEFDLPSWYFHKNERMAAAKDELEEAENSYQAEQVDYQDLLEEAGHSEIAAAEKRLAEARTAFSIAESLLDHDVGFEGREEIEDYRQTIYDAAETELEASQEEYQQLLSEPEAVDILEARARLSVARERRELARDHLQSFYTGDNALEVQIAKAAVSQAKASRDQAQARVDQAKSGVEGAEKALNQAKAARDVIELNLEKSRVNSPISGTILTRNIEPGEVIQAGLTAMTISQLDDLRVTVYIPEDQYGQISLGDQAQLQVDSFPDQVFEAEVTRIADKAEYTPRNVQTKEERQKTVYEIELTVIDGRGILKPGMPTDVVFLNSK